MISHARTGTDSDMNVGMLNVNLCSYSIKSVCILCNHLHDNKSPQINTTNYVIYVALFINTDAGKRATGWKYVNL